MASVFFSYCHTDEALRDKLEAHLSVLKREGAIDAWHDRRIEAGDDLNGEISAYLEAADIILLLVSSDFLNSAYCMDVELARALERHKQGVAKVIPIILRPCDWTPVLGNLRATPRDGKPVTRWPDVDEALLDVTQDIRKAVRRIGGSGNPSTAAPEEVSAGWEAQPPQVTAPRSSNLRVAKRFTDRDKDRFRIESFEYMSRFFEASLEELAKRNPGIEGDFRQIDANRFTAALYRDGVEENRCTVSLLDQGLGGGIAYSKGYPPSAQGFHSTRVYALKLMNTLSICAA
ncbi:toll/interleukin-1 receptor domain-containing protein [Salinicola tamaricis]|uniref:toll/interleukin-1 receptor domain-containing protein n=1 Tax=Salinicola tamaricis TaxID=1771309 RepID=UPI001A929EC8|nr:toll/interleukin-1 receptor domain-containing protein [Salinicola tamaricis]